MLLQKLKRMEGGGDHTCTQQQQQQQQCLSNQQHKSHQQQLHPIVVQNRDENCTAYTTAGLLNQNSGPLAGPECITRMDMLSRVAFPSTSVTSGYIPQTMIEKPRKKVFIIQAPQNKSALSSSRLSHLSSLNSQDMTLSVSSANNTFPQNAFFRKSTASHSQTLASLSDAQSDLSQGLSIERNLTLNHDSQALRLRVHMVQQGDTQALQHVTGPPATMTPVAHGVAIDVNNALKNLVKQRRGPDVKVEDFSSDSEEEETGQHKEVSFSNLLFTFDISLNTISTCNIFKCMCHRSIQ